MILRIPVLIILITFTGCEISYNSSDYQIEEYVSLNGEWKFSIGDDSTWAEPDLDDADWNEIYVPSTWEDEGFHGYNGYAWYRTEFEIPDDYDGRSLYLHLGYIDDVDEVFINGNLVGRSGSFPPDYNTAYNAYRKYSVPGNILNKNDKNIIAVRVYDSQLGGGIVSGDIGIYINPSEINPDINLIGEWKFTPGDDLNWKEKEFNDSNWVKIIVPGYWENQGFREYDGFAWYRKEFVLPSKLENKKLVLLLGKIDDLDEVYLNGILIGSTGVITKDTIEIQFSNEYLNLRGYYIPDNITQKGSNTIAARVYDGFRDGGIYEGPIGIVKQDTYIKYWNEKKKRKGFFE